MLVFMKDTETRQGVISRTHAVGAIKVTLYSDGVDPDSPLYGATIESTDGINIPESSSSSSLE